MEAFLDQLNEVVLTLTDFLSGKLLVVLLVGTGLWFTIRLGVLLNPFSATSISTAEKQAKTV